MGQEKMNKVVAPAAIDVTIGIDISKDHLDVWRDNLYEKMRQSG